MVGEGKDMKHMKIHFKFECIEKKHLYLDSLREKMSEIPTFVFSEKKYILGIGFMHDKIYKIKEFY